MSGAIYSPQTPPGVVLKHALDVPTKKNVDVCAQPQVDVDFSGFTVQVCSPDPRDVGSLHQEIQPPWCLFRPSHLQGQVCQRDWEELLPVYNEPFRTLEWLVTLNPLAGEVGEASGSPGGLSTDMDHDS